MPESSTRDTVRCVLDGDRPRPAAVGLLCARHVEQLGRLLDPDERGQVFARPDEPRTPPGIPVLWALLDATPARGEPVGGSVFRSTPPGDLRVMSHRDPRSHAAEAGDPWSVLGTLAAVARRLDARDVDGRPAPLPGRTVDAHCAWLYARLSVLCAAPWVCDAWYDLRALSGQLRAATGDPVARPFGTCRQPVDDDGRRHPDGPWRCATPLWLPEQAPKGADEPVDLPHVRCRGCGHTYAPVELVRIGRQRTAAMSAVSEPAAC